MTGERPDERPCDSCRWAVDGECVLRGRPRGGPEGDDALTTMPIPVDGGASCPPRLWSPREEPWYDHPTLVGSPAVWCADVDGLPPESDRALHREIAAGARRAGLRERPYAGGYRGGERRREIIPYPDHRPRR